ncbi:MAG: lipoprotein-releasing ABC transporter permease subunit [Magnetococcales bacterium]|nr:lipoprotein-releasing ABC transporter permease subunit [Magnetococcales bacterium]
MLSHRYEWMIGVRYLRAKRSQRFISVITGLSIGGIALGVAALIVVLAVMTGFKEELQKQILGVTSHIVVQGYGGKLTNHELAIHKIEKISGVVGVGPTVIKQVLLSARGNAVGVMLRGIDPKRDVSNLVNILEEGGIESLDELNGFGIVLGVHLAAQLGVYPGDHVTVMAPKGSVTVMGTMPRVRRFKVLSLFDSGMYEYDNTLAYVNIQDAQTLFRLNDMITTIEVLTDNPDNASSIRQTMDTTLNQRYWIRDWMQMNHNFFQALKLEKATMFVILMLVVLVAAFNIISSLIMVVMEKGKDIAILKTMGAGAGGVMAIFLINGSVIGILGTCSGVGLGLLLAFNLESTLLFIENLFGIQILSGQVYFIDHLPSVVYPSDVVWITCISLLISVLATIYPAWRASRVDPVEALRYE